MAWKHFLHQSPLWGESTSQQWIPLRKGQKGRALMCLSTAMMWFHCNIQKTSLCPHIDIHWGLNTVITHSAVYIDMNKTGSWYLILNVVSYELRENLQLAQTLTHWGRVTHICVSKLTIIGSDNGLPPGRHQAIIWTNAGILLIGPLGINLNEILIQFNTFSFKKMHLKMSSTRQS